jgi:hypothetical protein
MAVECNGGLKWYGDGIRVNLTCVLRGGIMDHSFMNITGVIQMKTENII